MAEFLWTFAVQEVLKKVLKVAAEEIGVALGFHKELSELREWLCNAEAILRGINTKKPHHESVGMWVGDLQRIVYEADDLLDELVYEDLRRKVETEKRKKVRNFFSSSNNPFLFRLKMAKRMKYIIEALHKHYTKAGPLGLIAQAGEESTETHKNIDLKQIRETTSKFKSREVIIGREVEVSNIVKLVVDSSNEHPMSIIPIVGMGGLGKTTLAKMVFNHELVQGHFDKTIWICVSEPFIVINILEGIFQSLTKTWSTGLNKENLLQRLQEEMQGKNYFLVLDDVWNEEATLWDDLKDCLNEIAGKSGNTIIVTTRSPDVATIMGTTSSIHLKKLSDDLCWSLFKKGVNADGLELEIIREEVVAKIGGVPLVAKVLGGAVKFEGHYERWMTKFRSVVKNISKDDKDFVSSILKLSVDCLPLLSLKQCFAYSSNFPKNYIFHKETLIQMWIAQGLIQPEEGNDELMEDIGERNFNFLLSRSLFEVANEDRGEIITQKTSVRLLGQLVDGPYWFMMHDLIHDIACAISKHQKVESNLTNSSDKIVRNLRRFIEDVDQDADGKFEDFVSLRILVVHDGSRRLFTSFGMFKHMRYLHITSCSAFFGLWKFDLESISMLYNLQTLKLQVQLLYQLPKDLRKLVKLRHIQFMVIPNQKMPLHMSQLVHLQTLSGFRVGYEEGRKIEEIGPLKNLKGALILGDLKKVKSKEEAMGARLMEKKNLTHLHFQWDSLSREDYNINDFGVLEGLQPHHNLQSLSIDDYTAQAFPNGIFVECLVSIFLRRCQKCEMLPMLGQLPNLEELFIDQLYDVRSIGREFYGTNNSNHRVFFPKLKKFSLVEMFGLENWEDVPNGMAFPHLTVLEIIVCPKLMSVPDHFVSLQTLQIYNCRVLTKLPNQLLEGYNHIESLDISGCPNLHPNMSNQYNVEDTCVEV
ncbi:putative disease resistance protein RGA3 [Benincasa hispida]|uniref:putative disease resistance protein RGA3 n=1 Tax=Benincasa hispida TaxID=102211 RepID=UPI00190223FB|nr:putative disease resistance protein RGA3 [Benincasa hispida]